MKAPSISFDKDAIVDFLLSHGEKVVGAVVGLGAIWLVWGGIDALQAKSAKPEQRPDAILAKVAEARTHIALEKSPPQQERWSGPSLVTAIEPWRSPELAVPFAGGTLRKPLFSERAKRTQPDVFPVEDLRATAGMAVLPPGKAPAGDVQQSQPRIAPYVLATGLIPVARQREEYRQRFAEVGFQQADRDVPVWSDWMIERAVGPDFGRWEKIDLAAVIRRQGAWAGIAADAVPDGYRLAAADEKPVTKDMPPYCGPLPQLAQGGWGSAALHPWVIEQIKKQQPEAAAEYRMFRFIDTDVAIGKSYRYRVRFALENPNFNVEARYLADPEVGKQRFLVASASKESPPVSVPGDTTVLLDMRKADPKKKTTAFEVLVLAPSGKSGGYALRGLITEPGGLINVDEKLNRPGDRRTRGEEVRTDRVLVDVRGRQEERADARSGLPEPFEILCLRTDDGSFEFVSTADSEAVIAEHKSTLPASTLPADEVKPPKTGPADTNPGKPGIDLTKPQ